MIKNKKLPISAVMVIYNEEKLLERAIKSCLKYVDELIIVDDGSIDKSIEIARKYTKKIYVLPHAGIAEHHRVFTYQHAKNNWILQIDADEYISPEFGKNLPRLIQKDVGIFEAIWSFYFQGKKFSSLRKRILFQKEQVYFIGAAQEYVKPITDSIVIEKIPYAIENNPSYESFSVKSFLRKQIPWAKIHAYDLTRPFKEIPKWNCSLIDWEKSTKIRLDHPIFLGMIGTTIYHMGYSLRDFLRFRSKYYIYQGIYLACYFIILYSFVYRLQHKRKI